MLTNSHQELENIVNISNNNSFSDVKDQKYNQLLKEIQMKDLHIQAIEKLIKIQNDNNNNNNNEKIAGKIYKNNSYKFSVGNNSNNNMNTSASFVKDEERENELKNMMKNFNTLSSNNNNELNNLIYQTNENNFNNNFDDEKNNNNNNKKIPGKIYRKN